MTITQSILEIVIPALASVLTAVSVMAIRRLQQKFDIELSASQEEMLKGTIRTAIASAEEWGARKAKLENIDRTAGAKKAEYALALIRAAYPQLSDSELVSLMDAELARADSMGATVKKVAV